MSGGSMDYLYSRVLGVEFELNTPERKAFAKHLTKVAKALRAIEWNDSDDGDPSESEAIRACIGDEEVFEVNRNNRNYFTLGEK